MRSLPPPHERHIVVAGGSGFVGQAVVRALRVQRARVTFTFFSSDRAAEALAGQTGATAVKTDLRAAEGIDALFDAAPGADGLVHCAGGAPADEDQLSALDDLYAVHVASAHRCVAGLLARLPAGAPSTAVLTSSVAGLLSVPAPPAFAATQAARQGLVRSLAKQHGAAGLHINLVALGVLDGGVSSSLDVELRAAYEKFSAYRRMGTADEAARAISWLTLDPAFMSGATVPVAGGL